MSSPMKDSGVEWIGEIPEHWGVEKLSRMGTFFSAGVDKKIREDEPQYKSVHYTDVYYNSIKEISNNDSYLVISATREKARKASLLKGDVLFTTSSETPEDIGHSTVVNEDLLDTLMGYHLIRFRPKNSNYYLPYQKFLFGCRCLREWFAFRANGMTRYGLRSRDFTEAPILVVPIKEQKRIADFLDEKTAQIDSIIDNTKQSIVEFKKYKQALITETVTKGLNPDVQMKDSRIEWIGEIPEHWDTWKLKQLFEIKKVIAGKLGHDILSITQNGLKIKDISNNEGQISADYSKYQIVDIGDFAMNHMDLLTGWVDCATFSGVTSPDYRVFKSRNSQTVDNTYYKYIFQACYSNKIFYGLGQGVSNLGRWRLPTSNFLNFTIPHSPIEEQQQIAAYLDEKCAHINSLIADKEKLIREFEDYKKALIYEYVTGKKEVD